MLQTKGNCNGSRRHVARHVATHSASIELHAACHAVSRAVQRWPIDLDSLLTVKRLYLCAVSLSNAFSTTGGEPGRLSR